MHAVVLSAFYSLTHLISGFHIGNWVVEEENGFPRVRQLVIGLESYAWSCASLQEFNHWDVPPSAFLRCPATCTWAFCCLLLSTTRPHPCRPSVLALISPQPVISLYLPAAGSSTHYYTFISHMSLHSVLIGIQFMKGQTDGLCFVFQKYLH